MKIEPATYNMDDVHPDITMVECWHAVDENGRELAVAAIASWNGLKWGCLNIGSMDTKQAVMFMLAIRRRLKSDSQTIRTVVNSDVHPTAERVNKVLGFECSGEHVEYDGKHKRIWLWQKSRH